MVLSWISNGPKTLEGSEKTTRGKMVLYRGKEADPDKTGKTDGADKTDGDEDPRPTNEAHQVTVAIRTPRRSSQSVHETRCKYFIELES